MVPIVIGALGTITEHTKKDLHKLRLHKQRGVLQMIVATSSVNILNNHLRRNDFDQ